MNVQSDGVTGQNALVQCQEHGRDVRVALGREWHIGAVQSGVGSWRLTCTGCTGVGSLVVGLLVAEGLWE